MADMSINLRQMRLDYTFEVGDVKVDVSLIRLEGDLYRMEACKRTATQTIPAVIHTATFSLDENKDISSDKFQRALRFIVNKVRQDESERSGLSAIDDTIDCSQEASDQVVPDIDYAADLDEGACGLRGHFVPF